MRIASVMFPGISRQFDILCPFDDVKPGDYVIALDEVQRQEVSDFFHDREHGWPPKTGQPTAGAVSGQPSAVFGQTAPCAGAGGPEAIAVIGRRHAHMRDARCWRHCAPPPNPKPTFSLRIDLTPFAIGQTGLPCQKCKRATSDPRKVDNIIREWRGCQSPWKIRHA